MFSWDVLKDCLFSLDSTGFFFKLEMLMNGLSGEPVSNWILMAHGFSSSRFCMVWYRFRDTFFYALFFLLDVLSDFMFSWDVHLDLFFLNCLFFFFKNLLKALRFCLHLSVSATSVSIFGCFESSFFCSFIKSFLQTSFRMCSLSFSTALNFF